MNIDKSTSLTLKNGRTMPIVGLGTFSPKFDDDLVISAIKDAVKAGYRHLDCAPRYRNEKAVGSAIQDLIAEGVVTREELFITSKLWNTYHRPDLVEIGLRMTLDDLGLDYLDLFIIHWPFAYKEGCELVPTDRNGKIIFSDVDYVDTWKALEDCVDKGLVRSIGLSNFNRQQTQRILDAARIKPANNQIEVNILFNNKKLVDLCKDNGIVVTAASPLGSAETASASYFPLLQDPTLKGIALKYNKTPAQIALRYLVEEGLGILPKSFNSERMRQNLDVFNFSLSSSDKEQLTALNRDCRVYKEEAASEHAYYPFHEDV